MIDRRVFAGFGLAFGIGVLCRVAGVPLPAPPAIIGATLVLAMTTGYLLVDRYAGNRANEQAKNCGGPNGDLGCAPSGALARERDGV